MEQVTTQVVQLLIEVVFLTVGVLGSIALHKAQNYLEKLKQSNQTSQVANLAYNVVNLAEAKLKDGSGADKFNLAESKLSQILASKKINVTTDEIHAAIETAVSHLPKEFAAEVSPIVQTQPIATVVVPVDQVQASHPAQTSDSTAATSTGVQK